MKLLSTSAMVLVTAVMTVTPLWAKPSIPELVQQCRDKGKRSACEELARIAVSGELADDRKAALAGVSDQPLLAKIAQDDPNEAVRENAAIFLKDVPLLKKVAVDAPDEYVRLMAVRKLSDQPFLEKIAAGDKEAMVRAAAARLVSGQQFLERLAATDSDPGVRLAATAKLTGPFLPQTIGEDLTCVATEGQLSDRSAVLGRIWDQAILEKAAESGWSESANPFRQAGIRLLAAGSILEPAALGRVIEAWKSRPQNNIEVVQLIYNLQAMLGLRQSIAERGIEKLTGRLRIVMDVDSGAPTQAFGGGLVTGFGERMTVSIRTGSKVHASARWETNIPEAVRRPVSGTSVVFLPPAINPQQLVDDLAKASTE